MSTGLTSINRALNLIPKRAEQRQVDQLRETFVDSGVAAAVQAIDHQVLYGRRVVGQFELSSSPAISVSDQM